MNVEVLADADAVAGKAAAIIAAEARAAIAARGRFILAVSGGHTPWLMLRALAGQEVPWEGLHETHGHEQGNAWGYVMGFCTKEQYEGFETRS